MILIASHGLERERQRRNPLGDSVRKRARRELVAHVLFVEFSFRDASFCGRAHELAEAGLVRDREDHDVLAVRPPLGVEIRVQRRKLGWCPKLDFGLACRAPASIVGA